MTGLAGVNKQPPLKRAAAALAHSLTGAPAGPEQRALSWRSSQRHRGQGARGWSPTAEPTKPHHTIPCHTMPELFLPSLNPPPPPDALLLNLACIVCLQTQTQGFPPRPSSPNLLTIPTDAKVRLDLKEVHSVPDSTTPAPFFVPPDSVHGSAWTWTERRFEVAARTDDKWTGRWGWNEGCGTSEEAGSYEEAASPLFFLFFGFFFVRWGCVCVVVCVCLACPHPSLCEEATGFLIKSSEPAITETFTKL